MSAHRQKRAFNPPSQPSITLFFTPSSNHPSSAPTPTHPSTPPLPSAVQSSLLNVGMRVRKSVPEGYKTHYSGKQSSYFPHSHDNYHHAPHDPPPTSAAAADEPTLPPPRPAELLPFCGLLEIGNFAAQHHHPTNNLPFSASAFAASHTAADDDSSSFTTPFSSQTSAVSTDSVPRVLARGKRTFDDADSDADSDVDADTDAPLTAGASATQARPRRRTLAQVRSGGRGGGGGAHRGGGLLQRRSGVGKAFAVPLNRSWSYGSAGVAEEEDFEEAEFLRPRDGEVEMGGV